MNLCAPDHFVGTVYKDHTKPYNDLKVCFLVMSFVYVVHELRWPSAQDSCLAATVLVSGSMSDL